MSRLFLFFAFCALALSSLFAAEPNIPLQGRPGGYVGATACQACHKDEFTSWHQSYHRTMTQYATNDAVQADFNNVTLNFRGEEFKLQKIGGEFWVSVIDKEEPRPKSDEKSEPGRFKIGMLTGSHHMQVFWLPIGAGNAQLGFPFTWLNEDKRWVPREATFLRDPNLPPPQEIWNVTCVRCHSTAPQPRPDKFSQVYRTRVAEMGIACEACHGPGEQHIAFQEKLKIEKPAKKPDDPHITHPAKLPHDRASQICAQCHSMKYFDQKSNWLENGFAFRPGENLEESTPVMRPRKIEEQPFLKKAVENNPGLLNDFFWKDGMMRVSGREYNGLIESPCFQKGALSCLSCHSMHDSKPDDQLKAGMNGNKACLQCHDKFEQNLTAHTRHKANSAGSECYNCHMPNTTYGLLKAMRSHEISNPNVAESVEVGRPNACNLCHLDKSLAWTADHLKDWSAKPVPALSDQQKKIPAGVLWALKGDAGQRALAAWHFGWKPAQEASGNFWMAPFLAQSLNDPYAAVRYIAGRSMKTLPGFSNFKYNHVAEERSRQLAISVTMAQWRSANTNKTTVADLIMIPVLLGEQDKTPIHLRE